MMAEPALSLAGYIKIVEEELGKLLIAFFELHHPNENQSEALLNSHPAAKKFANATLFLLQCLAENWNAYAKFYGIEYPFCQRKIESASLLLRVGAFLNLLLSLQA